MEDTVVALRERLTNRGSNLTALSTEQLRQVARAVRRNILLTAHHAGAGHVGGSLSAAEVLTALYFRHLRVDLDDPSWPDRDRFVLSKGHCGLGLYVVMALRGFFPVDELATFDADDTRLQMHPDMKKLPGLDMSTGSLGQGLSIGLGMALGARQTKRPSHTYVLLGDGELQEGMTWEAIHTAPRHRVTNLTAIVDHNRQQQYGYATGTGGERRQLDPWRDVDIVATAQDLGWQVHGVDGHDLDQVLTALSAPAASDRPTMIVCRTIKGKGVSFMEGVTKWHSGAPSRAELDTALAALEVV